MPELAELLDQRPGELGALPVVVDRRAAPRCRRTAGPRAGSPAARGELLAEEEVVGGQAVADAHLQVLGHRMSSVGTMCRRVSLASRNSSISRGEAFGSGDQFEVAARVDVQPGTRDERGEQVPVDRGDDRVVVAGEDQGRLPQQRQEADAGPAGGGQQLEGVAAAGTGPGCGCAGGERACPGRGGRCRRRCRRRDAAQEVGVGVAARGGHAREDAGRAGTMSVPVPVATSTSLRHRLAGGPRELLRQPAAPGDAQDVDAVVAENVEQASMVRASPGSR